MTNSDRARAVAAEQAFPDFGKARQFARAITGLCSTCGREKTYWWNGLYFCRPCRNAASRRYTAKRRKPVVPPTHCRNGHPRELVYLTAGPRCATCVKQHYLRRKQDPAYALYQRRWARERRASGSV